MNRYDRGRRKEQATMRLLEAAGYTCTRSAGSHGPFDVWAVSSTDIVLAQVKLNGRPSAEEEEAMRLVRVPKNARKLVYLFTHGSRKPPLVKEVR